MKKNILLVLSLVLLLSSLASAAAPTIGGWYQMNFEHAASNYNAATGDGPKIQLKNFALSNTMEVNFTIDERQSGVWRFRGRIAQLTHSGLSAVRDRYELTLTPGDFFGLQNFKLIASQNYSQNFYQDPLMLVRLHNNRANIRAEFGVANFADVVVDFDHSNKHLVTYSEFEVAGFDLGLIWQNNTTLEEGNNTFVGFGTFDLAGYATAKVSAGLTAVKDLEWEDFQEFAGYGVEVDVPVTNELALNAVYRHLGPDFAGQRYRSSDVYSSAYTDIIDNTKRLDVTAKYTLDNLQVAAKYRKEGPATDEFNTDIISATAAYWTTSSQPDWLLNIRGLAAQDSLVNAFATSRWMYRISRMDGLGVEAEVKQTKVGAADGVITVNVRGGGQVLKDRVWVITDNDYNFDSKDLVVRFGVNTAVTKELTIAPRLVYTNFNDDAKSDTINTITYASYAFGNRVLWAEYRMDFTDLADGWKNTTQQVRTALRVTF